MILETERLYLRWTTSEDLDYEFEMFGDKEFVKYVGGGETLTLEQIKDGIERYSKSPDKGGLGRWTIVNKVNGEHAGRAGIFWTPDKSDIEIAYFIRRKYQGKGFASEIAKALLDYGFNELKLDKITAWVYPENTSSIKVIEKLGMNYEGIKEYKLKEGSVMIRKYLMKKEEYKKP